MSVVGTDRKGHSFEKRVAYFFALHGYQVDHDVEIAGRQIDLLIESRTSLFTERYLVECKDLARPVNAQEYDKFKTVLDSARRALDPKLRGVIVASVGFTRSIKAQSAHDEIRLITISELEQSFIDFRSYVRNLIVRLQSDPDLEWYVEPRVRREHATLAEPASRLFDQWLTDAELNQLTLLGDYGTGKTTFLKQVALQMGEKYETEVLEGGARGRVPIFVDLSEHAHDLSLREIVVALLKSYRVQVESYEVFDYMLRDGQILLLLDGFDEMASRGSYETTLRNFRRLNQSVLGKAKIVLSSRTHYFTTETALHRVLGDEGSFADLTGGFTQLYRDIAQRPNFKIVYMEEFGRDQVDDYLHKRYGQDDGRLRGFIEGTYNLEELSKRPVFLDMIVDSRERLQTSSDAVTAGILYQLYSNDWLSRNDWCTQLDVATKSELLQWFADRVDQEPDYLLPHKRISDLIKSWQPGIQTTDEQDIDRELRSASFLVRDEEGNYKFSHGSFQEFFLARHLLSMAAKNQESSWGKRFFKGEVYRFLRDLVPADENAIDSLLDWIGDGSRSWIARANATKVVSAATEYCETVPRLLEALKSEDQGQVRPYILTALGYFCGDDVTAALKTVILEDPVNVARGNALAALARCGGDGDFVLSVLNGEVPAVEVDAQTLWPLFKQAPDLQDDRIARAILSRRPLDRRSRMASMCLRICQRQSVPETERYCRDVLEVTKNPRVAANAFELLPIALRKQIYPRILQLFEGRKRMGSKIRLIECLKGLRQPEVGEFLTELVERAALAAPPVTFKLLQSDYPEVLAEHADDWGRRGRPHLLRLAVAEHLAKVGGATELDKLEQMLSPRERPRLKLEVLRMMFEANEEFFAKAVKARWAQEPAPYVARYAMELLRTVDTQAAIELMLTKGIENPRPGTRIAVCTLLGDEKGERATQALLDRVSQDESPWVRRQALRSLLSPGRGIDSAEVLEATSAERDEVVLSLRRELLG